MRARTQSGDVLVEDNLDAHNVADVGKALQVIGASIFYLPPCSPDLNPIEQLRAELKGLLRKAVTRA